MLPAPLKFWLEHIATKARTIQKSVCFGLALYQHKAADVAGLEVHKYVSGLSTLSSVIQ